MTAFLYLRFNAIDLTTLTDITITKIEKDDLPPRRITEADRAQADGRSISSAFFSGQQVVVSGYINSTDHDAFKVAQRLLTQYLVPLNAKLDIIESSNVVRFTATVESNVYSEQGAGFGTFTITFKCKESAGYDPNMKFLLASTVVTAATSTQSLASVAGNYKALPCISVYVNSGTGLTGGKNVVLTNPATGYALTVSRDWVVGELLEVDCYNGTVQVNRVNVDWSGAFPYIDVGAGQSIQYDDTFTTRNINLIVKYLARYI